MQIRILTLSIWTVFIKFKRAPLNQGKLLLYYLGRTVVYLCLGLLGFSGIDNVSSPFSASGVT